MYTNSTTSPRTAHISVGGQTFTITQAGSTETPGQRVVRALYQTILGREPDSGGWAFWTGSGAPKGANGAVLFNQMADGFYTSPEFSGSGFETLSLYQAATGSLPSFNTWLTTVRQLRGQTLTTSQLVTTLMGSLSNAAFVQQVVRNSYGRPATSAELSQYTNLLSASTAANPKLDLLDNTIFQNAAFKNQTNAEFVTMLYFTILVRDADSGGLSFWKGQVDPPTAN